MIPPGVFLCFLKKIQHCKQHFFIDPFEQFFNSCFSSSSINVELIFDLVILFLIFLTMYMEQIKIKK